MTRFNAEPQPATQRLGLLRVYRENVPQYGVDVHDGYQAGLSFRTLVQQGYSFAVVKLTQGTWYARDQGDEWVQAARFAGLIPGGYHWLERGDGAGQARYFMKKVIEAGGPEGMLIQLDCEATAGWDDIQAWHKEWMRLTAHPYLLYTGGWWWNVPGRRWPGVTLTPYLWHSHYLLADLDTIPDDPAAFAARVPASWWNPGYGGWDRASILQFTSKGDAGGLGNNVDLNVTMLSRTELLNLTRSKPLPPAPAEDVMGIQDDDYTWTESGLYRLVGLDAYQVGNDEGLKKVYARRKVAYEVQGGSEIHMTDGELHGGWRVHGAAATPPADTTPAAIDYNKLAQALLAEVLKPKA